MIKFITWPAEIDESFRVFYAETVGEMIQDNPEQSENLFLVGSSRLKQHHCDALVEKFDTISITDTMPENFVRIENGNT